MVHFKCNDPVNNGADGGALEQAVRPEVKSALGRSAVDTEHNGVDAGIVVLAGYPFRVLCIRQDRADRHNAVTTTHRGDLRDMRCRSQLHGNQSRGIF